MLLQNSQQDGQSRPRWYLVQCKPRQDLRALEHLERQGYLCFLPLRTRLQRIKGRECQVDEALFPGYLFIRLAPSDNWSALRSTRGVARVVSFGGNPLPVCDAVMLAVERLCAYLPDAVALSPGDQVVVDMGAANELEAVFLSVEDGGERALLLVRMMQREHKVCLPLANVRSRTD